MLYEKLPTHQKEYYEKMLSIIGSLSGLFSESNIPYIDSRISENLFCKAFKAENKGRDDSSADAVYKKVGIGIKTFRGNSAQKVAEFNKFSSIFNKLKTEDKIIKISELRNKRIEFTKRSYNLDSMIYHCIRRDSAQISIKEYPMELISINKLNITKDSERSIAFTDGANEYIFNISKSVLMKKFPKENPEVEIDVKILEDPFELLESSFKGIKETIAENELPYIILPLYSFKDGEKVVPERSGLNQWNAAGRVRNEDEVYIRIPSWIHSSFEGFFPARDTQFTLNLPDGNVLDAKVCQDNSKALMSKKNKELGKWILRDILQVPVGELITMELLDDIGIDSVIIKKISDSEFSIDFAKEGSFDKFEEDYK